MCTLSADIMEEAPFWMKKSPGQMSRDEWESLCDGCGICCLEKVEDGRTGEVRLIGVSCDYLDLETCRCIIYEVRMVANPRCTELTPQNIVEKEWLPPNCAYRTVMEGRELPGWHHLVSGDPETVHRAGMSVRHRAIPGAFVHPADKE
jgi:uncharacterized cysteine cluster protein YcgN (CxxCxxCC family)